VAAMPQETANVIRDVVIEQEPHRSGSAICSITCASISVRWSS
jgi:hypothetical protein